MYSVIIVEDQQFIANTIAATIRKNLTDFQVDGVYANGKECLDHLGDTTPDIILTDIKMPVMDGLMLSEQLVKRCPNTKIIILTGYDDFNYARTAIRLGITNYLLKPCSRDDLAEALGSAARKIDLERQNTAALNAYYQNFIGNLPTLRQQAVISLLFHYHACTKNDLINMHSGHLLSKCALFLLDFDFTHSPENPADTDLLLFCSNNILNELLERITNTEIFLCNEQILIIFPLANSTYEEVTDVLSNAAQQLNSVLKSKVTLCEGGIMEDIFSCRQAYQAALSRLTSNSPKASDRSGDTLPGSVSTLELLEKATTYIMLHYSEDLSLQDVADRIFISYNYLSSLFSQHLGMNFSVYLTKVRIEKACELLNTPGMRVVDIAELVGYQNYRYFNHVFKKMTGFTPTDYRRVKLIDG